MNSWRRPRDLGEIVRGAWRLYTGNFTPLFLIALVTAPLQLLGVIVQRTAGEAVAATVSFFLIVPTIAVALVAAGALVHAIHAVTGADPADAGSALDAGLSRFADMLGTAFLLLAMVFLALFAFPFLAIAWLARPDLRIDGRREWYFLVPLVLPAYLVLRWAFYPQAVMVEGARAWRALDLSADAVRHKWWRVLGITLVIGLLQAGPLLLAGAASVAPPLIEASVSSLITALVLPFAIAAQTLLYYDLKARKFLDLSPPAVAAAEPDVQGEGPRDV